MRLDKYLAKCGLGSRAITKKIIKQKRVTVFGEVVVNTNQEVTEGVAVDGIEVTFKEFIYFMLNKPKGVISASSDKSHKTVVDLFKGYEHYGLFPVGRLDKNTTGLLIITNDGKLTHELISPRRNKPKTYLCTLKKPFENFYIQAIKEGIPLSDFFTKPGIVKKVSENVCELTIFEGKYHQVKRMFTTLGNEITELHRLSMNELHLDEALKPGEFKELSEEELNILKN